MGKMQLDEAKTKQEQENMPVDFSTMPGWSEVDDTYRKQIEGETKRLGGTRRAFNTVIGNNKNNLEMISNLTVAKAAGYKNKYMEMSEKMAELQEQLKVNPGDKVIAMQIRELEPKLAGIAERSQGAEKSAEKYLTKMDTKKKFDAAPPEWKAKLAPAMDDPVLFNALYLQLEKDAGALERAKTIYEGKGTGNKLLQEAHVKGVRAAVDQEYLSDAKLGPIITERLRKARIMNPQTTVFDVLEPYQRQAYQQMVMIGSDALQGGVVKDSVEAGRYARDNRLKYANYDPTYKGDQDQAWSVTSKQDPEQIEAVTRAVAGKQDQISKGTRDPKTGIITIIFTNGNKIDIPPTRKPGGGKSMEFRNGPPPNPVSSSMEFRGESPAGSTGLGATREKKVHRLEDYLGR
jgi:hypothetical protein